MNIKEAMDLELPEGRAIMIAMNHTGDERLEWDTANPESVKLAKETFKRYKEKGYVAYRIESSKADPQGRKGSVLHDFDPDAQRTIFRPPMQGGSC